MFRFSLRQLMTVSLIIGICIGIFGLIFNHAKIISVLFPNQDKHVVIESSNVVPRGTFFKLYQGNFEVIGKTEISERPYRINEFERFEVDKKNRVAGYFHKGLDPESLSLLLMVDFRNDAFSCYWGGCRANKCKKVTWEEWDRLQNKFELILNRTALAEKLKKQPSQ